MVHVTLKTEVMAAENSTLHHRNKLHFKIENNEHTIHMAGKNIMSKQFNQILMNIRCPSSSKLN